MEVSGDAVCISIAFLNKTVHMTVSRWSKLFYFEYLLNTLKLTGENFILIELMAVSYQRFFWLEKE